MVNLYHCVRINTAVTVTIDFDEYIGMMKKVQSTMDGKPTANQVERKLNGYVRQAAGRVKNGVVSTFSENTVIELRKIIKGLGV